MYKPTRRVHTSTGRFPFSQRSPSKRRAFLGVFNITKSFGRHDKCQRPRISLQIKRCQPITPPIIRRKHRELPIFCPRSVCRGLRLQNTRKNARRHHPHMARTKTKARPSFPAHSAGRKNPRRTKCAARASCMSEDAPEGNSLSARTCSPRAVRQITRRCKPSCAYPRQHRTGCQSGSREASSSQDRSRCSQPGRSQSRRHRRPCCRSRPPER